MANTIVNTAKYVTPEGVETKPLYIKNFSLADWDALNKLRTSLGGKSVADAVRFSIRKAAGII